MEYVCMYSGKIIKLLHCILSSHTHSYLLQEGYAAVHLAAMYSREETIRHLVQRKADINAVGGVGHAARR